MSEHHGDLSRRMLLLASTLLGALLVAGCGPNMAEQFERAKSEGTLAALDGFVSSNPKNPYGDEIQELRDDIRFKEAQSEGTLEAMETYLADFEAGKHADEAKAQLDDLRWLAAEKRGEVAGYKEYLEQQPKGKHVREARRKVGDAELAELQKAGSAKEIATWLKGKGHSMEQRDRAFRLLDDKAQAEAGDAGIIRFPKVKRDKMIGYTFIQGYAGGRVLELDSAKYKGPDKLEWKSQGKGKKAKVKGPELKGNLTLELVGDALPDEPITLVTLLKVAGRSYVATQPLKLNKKALLKKKQAPIKAKLSWPEPPAAAGKAKVHLFLVQGALPDKPTDFSPISNILVHGSEVVLPEALLKEKAEKATKAGKGTKAGKVGKLEKAKAAEEPAKAEEEPATKAEKEEPARAEEKAAPAEEEDGE